MKRVSQARRSHSDVFVNRQGIRELSHIPYVKNNRYYYPLLIIDYWHIDSTVGVLIGYAQINTHV
jgi:hypothetical protein